MSAQAKADLYASINEAATELGVSRDTVVRMVARHELEAERIAGRTVIVRASLDRARAAKESQ